MLRPVPMARLGVLALDSRATALTRLLARSGVIQIEAPAPVLGLATAVSRSSIARYEVLEAKLAELAQHLGVRLVSQGSPFEVEVEPEREIGELEGRIEEITGEVRELQEQLAALAAARRKLTTQIEELLLLSPVPWKLEELREPKHVSIQIGVLRDVNIRRVEAALGGLPHVLVRLPGPATGWDLVLVFCQKTSHEQVRRTLAGANFNPIAISEELTGLPVEAEERLWEKQRALAAQREELTKRLRETISAGTVEIRSLWEKVHAARLVLATQQSYGKTAKVVYVAGWVPKESVPSLTSSIQSTLGTSAYIEARDPLPGDPPIPVKLKNPSVFKPFEEIVTTYSLPNPREIDPTVVVAVTYLLMFGVMFGDLGQGLVLAFAGFWASTKWSDLKNIGRILGMCGLSSMIFGLVFGSVFGVEVEIIPAISFPLIEHHTLVRADNLTVLGAVTIAYGIVMLSVGIIFNIINSIRVRQWGVVVFDVYGIVGLLFFWCALAWAGLKIVGVGGVVTSVLGVTLLVCLLLLFAREPIIRAVERQHHLIEGGPALFVVQALIDLMDTVIRFLSNTISFVRVAAFALTHGALFMAVHTIGVMISGQPAGLGYVMAFIVGNVFVIAMEGLIVSIQCLRLEYYEIFGKFFRGGGTQFTPLHAV